MISILIVAEESDLIKELTDSLIRRNLDCLVVSNYEQAMMRAKEKNPGLIIADIDDTLNLHQIMNLYAEVGMARKPLIILLAPRVMIMDLGNKSDVTDFIVKPGDMEELSIRVQRLVNILIKDTASKNIMRFGDLVIDTAGYEVYLDGRLIELTFKEYELLRMLATNKGRVFSREALLNKVWKYDYIGGERTVDVHIRRLRSKIEDADYKFIETIRNIGYRFRKDP